MAKPDEGHILTEKALAKLEKKIASVYGEAAKEMQTTIDDYFSSFAKRDKEIQALIGSTVNGKEWTKENYKQWRLNQIGRGKRLEALRDKLAERVTQANETAVAYTNDTTPGIYSLNRNYTAYTIEQVSDAADFTLWDEQTVKRLAVERPDLMPYYPKKQALKRGIDLEYGKKQITASITSSILQGKSIKGIADDLQERITTMSRASAIRTARTAVTGAQNAGRMDSYAAAEKMGIKLKKEWLATLDGRTRHAHAMLDGQTVDTDKPFKVDGYELMYPGDRSAPGYLVYNCRCTTIAVLPDVDTSDAQRWSIDPETGERKLVSNMSYQEWAGWKEKEQKTVANSVQSGTVNLVESTQQNITALHDRLEQAKTTDEVSAYTQEYFREKGSKIQTVNFGKADVSAAKEMAEMLDELDSTYKSSLTGVGVRRMSDALGGSATPSDSSARRFFSSGDPFELESTISLNETFLRTQKAIISDFEINNRSRYGGVANVAQVDKKYAAVSTLVHEFGHTICPGKVNEIYQQQGGLNSHFTPLKRQYNMYMRELRDKQREIVAVRESFAGQPDGLRLGLEAAKDLQAEYDAMCISNYSKESVGEFIAEAFCDAVCSSNPKPASVKVLETIKKLYGKE